MRKFVLLLALGILGCPGGSKWVPIQSAFPKINTPPEYPYITACPNSTHSDKADAPPENPIRMGGLCMDDVYLVVDAATPAEWGQALIDAAEWWNTFLPRKVFYYGGAFESKHHSAANMSPHSVLVRFTMDDGLLWSVQACGITVTTAAMEHPEKGVCLWQQSVTINIVNPCSEITGGTVRVLIHELGHVLGLGHSQQPGTVMQPSVNPEEWEAVDVLQFQWLQEWYAVEEPESLWQEGQPDERP